MKCTLELVYAVRLQEGSIANLSNQQSFDRASVREVQEGTGEGGLVRGKYRAENISVLITE